MGSALYHLKKQKPPTTLSKESKTNKVYLGTSYSNEFIEKNLINLKKLKTIFLLKNLMIMRSIQK